MTRLPFAAHALFQWDSVLYANALEHGFHVDTEIANERPHPPGYILYLALAALVRVAARDSNVALVAIAIVASAATVAAAYLLMRAYAARSVALGCALGLAASPLFWQESEVALPYTVLALLSILLAAAFRAARAGRLSLAAVSLAFGLACGMRQDLALLFAPMWVWAAVPGTWRTRAVALAAGAIGCLAWVVPSAMLSGGASAYAAAVTGQTVHVGTTFSVGARGATGLVQNLAFTGYALVWGLAAFAAVLAVVGAALLLARRGRARGDAAFFALWLVPPLVVYVVLHIGYAGYALSVLPGAYVLVAVALSSAAPRSGAAVAGALAIANAALFLVSSSQFSAGAIAAHDASVTDRVAYVRQAYEPAQVTLVAQFDYELARYYLSEYRTLFVGDGPDVLSREPRPVILDPAVDHVVAFGVMDPLPDGLVREPIAPELSGLDRVGGVAGAKLTAYAVESR